MAADRTSVDSRGVRSLSSASGTCRLPGGGGDGAGLDDTASVNDDADPDGGNSVSIPDLARMTSMGVARRNRGMLPGVQYRRKPTFLLLQRG